MLPLSGFGWAQTRELRRAADAATEQTEVAQAEVAAAREAERDAEGRAAAAERAEAAAAERSDAMAATLTAAASELEEQKRCCSSGSSSLPFIGLSPPFQCLSALVVLVAVRSSDGRLSRSRRLRCSLNMHPKAGCDVWPQGSHPVHPAVSLQKK